MTGPGHARQGGETLVGLMIGLALGALVLAGGTHMLATLLRGHRQALQDTQLQQDLYFALELMASELQDAQYVAGASQRRHPRACGDAFCDGPEDFSLGSDRLDWTLDRDHNGLQDNDECTGLRLRAGALQVRTACVPEVWTPLSETSTLRLTRLQAQLQCERRGGWLHRRVAMRLEAQSPRAPERTLQWDRTVVLRNALPEAVAGRYCP